jgi:hypothetical protein
MTLKKEKIEKWRDNQRIMNIAQEIDHAVKLINAAYPK